MDSEIELEITAASIPIEPSPPTFPECVTARLFVEEGAYVFITGHRQKELDEAVDSIGRNVTGVQGDAGKLADLDRLYETVKAKKGHIS